MQTVQSEQDIQADAPVVLFTVADDKGDMVDHEVALLIINEAEKWLDGAAKNVMDAEVVLGQLGTASTKAREAKKEYTELMMKAIGAYSPGGQLTVGWMKKKLSHRQVVHAFYTLRDLTDPFEQTQVIQMDRLRRLMGGMPEAVVEAGLDAMRKQS